MTLDHVAIWTHKLEILKDYYIGFFGACVNSKYRNSETGFESYFLSFESGSRIEIMQRPSIPENLNDTINSQHTGIIHLAFAVKTREQVIAKSEELKNAGFRILRGPRETGDGYFEFETLDPDNNRIEVITTIPEKKKKEIAAIILENDKGEFLLYLREDKPGIPFPDHWDLIGGHVEEGETPEQALIREVREELGIELHGYKFFRTYECITGDAYPNTKFIFSGKINTPIEDITLYEGVRPKYFTREEIPHVKFANILQSIVMDFINSRTQIPLT